MSTYELKVAIDLRPESVPTDGCRVLESSRELLQAVWNEVAADLSRLISAMGMPADRIDDVLQDVYLAAWQKPPKDIDAVALRRWLFRVTANRCNLEHRRRKRWRIVWAGVARIWPRSNMQQGADGAARQNEERRLIQVALDTLPPLLRSVLVLRYFSEFNSKEIGAILELPDPTVRSHLRRARRLLAGELKKAGLGDE